MDCVKSAKELKKIAKEKEKRFYEEEYAKANAYAPNFEKVICKEINNASNNGRRYVKLWAAYHFETRHVTYLGQYLLFGFYGPSELVKSIKKFKKMGYKIFIRDYPGWELVISW